MDNMLQLEEKGGKEKKGEQVSVVLRVRPMSMLEKRTRAAPIVTVQGSNRVTIQTGPISEDRQYVFDRVYDQNASQADIFENSIKPVVDDVMKGFNCTVFAYGQTGTGKTYTMEGKLTNDVNHPHAGVIPRCVHSIFERLAKYSEFSVKVSFLEIYNEELNDLLDSTPKDLRIVEDTVGKKGMMVHGLEEVIVENADAVFNLLKVAQEKRKTAETKLNENSSRSHCVFAITVHHKEARPEGEDVIKTGRMHLVDLAGSECVAKSGAVAGRAKEAGKINQSLLTLGRVITCLVDKTGYIPYRDSKLTRLLQESLGGRAKTVIVATISPSADCADVTSSTLDYAHRAKDIKNKPQINQKMAKGLYMQELMSKISDLKRDNEVLREKNGIILAPEKWTQIEEDIKEKTMRLEELEISLRASDAELRELQALFGLTTEELAQVKAAREALLAEVAAMGKELAQLTAHLEATKTDLAEAQHLMGAHQATEEELFGKATAQKQLLEDTIQDTRLLHAKIGRKAALEQQHFQAGRDLDALVKAPLQALKAKVDDFAGAQQAAGAALGQSVGQFALTHAGELAALAGQVEALSQGVERGQAALAALALSYASGLQGRSAHHDAAHQAQCQSMLCLAAKASADLRATAADITARMQQQAQQVLGWKLSTEERVALSCSAAQAFAQESKVALLGLQGALQRQEHAQKEALDRSQREVAVFVQKQEASASAAAASLLANVTELFHVYRTTQHQQLAGGLEVITADLANQAEMVSGAAAANMAAMAALAGTNASFEADISQQRAGTNAMVAERHKEVSEVQTELLAALAHGEQGVADTINQLARAVQAQEGALHAQLDTEARAVGELAAAHTGLRDQLVQEAVGRADAVREGIDKVVSASAAKAQAWQEQVSAAGVRVAGLVAAHADAQAVLADRMLHFAQSGLQEDVVTGQTPAKDKARPYPSTIKRTRPHEQLLESFRAKRRNEVAGAVEAVEEQAVVVPLSLADDKENQEQLPAVPPTPDSKRKAMAEPASVSKSRIRAPMQTPRRAALRPRQ